MESRQRQLMMSELRLVDERQQQKKIKEPELRFNFFLLTRGGEDGSADGVVA